MEELVLKKFDNFEESPNKVIKTNDCYMVTKENNVYVASKMIDSIVYDLSQTEIYSSYYSVMDGSIAANEKITDKDGTIKVERNAEVITLNQALGLDDKTVHYMDENEVNCLIGFEESKLSGGKQLKLTAN